MNTEKVRPLCATHPLVNYKTAWGCPECVAELRKEKQKLTLEVEKAFNEGWQLATTRPFVDRDPCWLNSNARRVVKGEKV